jgi:hypothetical protein
MKGNPLFPPLLGADSSVKIGLWRRVWLLRGRILAALRMTSGREERRGLAKLATDPGTQLSSLKREVEILSHRLSGFASRKERLGRGGSWCCGRGNQSRIEPVE